MKAHIQRVSQARVLLPEENNRIAGQIKQGFLILLGVGLEDTEEDVKYLSKKIANLRIFDDGEGRMNLNLTQVGGKVLVVSQFTLLADCIKGNRPSFTNAARPEEAKKYYRMFILELNYLGIETEEGVFQANMSVELVNDGPVTICLDSKDRLVKK